MNQKTIKKALENLRLAVIGLGYVGFPLAVEFGKRRSVIGFDVNKTRISALSNGIDVTGEVTEAEFASAINLKVTSDESSLSSANCFIITVPTPIDNYKKPDISALIKASETVGKYLKKGGVVIYESTVYPGATEEECVPILERHSKLKFNTDFFVGYSPERINPGDKNHRLTNICKITSGSTPESSELIDSLYKEIITIGTYRVESIRIAEAAKVIENTQRDLNIALVNELTIIFDRMGIDTESVLNAAGTKWNFLPFRPGFVGGHCIGVDPYYLMHKAESLGCNPQLITSGRRINDNMASFAVSKLIKAMLKKRIQIENSRALVLGLAFKENCPDIRNTGVLHIINELQEFNMEVDVFDPVVDAQDALEQLNIKLIEAPDNRAYDTVILAVPHKVFSAMSLETVRRLGKENHLLYDLKYLWSQEDVDLRL
jgi:UDP-N-acetyl-D-glucosamine/UDP-N-acetyl-D-galactosamine dehydrogenase